MITETAHLSRCRLLQHGPGRPATFTALQPFVRTGSVEPQVVGGSSPSTAAEHRSCGHLFSHPCSRSVRRHPSSHSSRTEPLSRDTSKSRSCVSANKPSNEIAHYWTLRFSKRTIRALADARTTTLTSCVSTSLTFRTRWWAGCLTTKRGYRPPRP
jgi:hypothetical protein